MTGVFPGDSANVKLTILGIMAIMGWKVATLCILALACIVLAEGPLDSSTIASKRHARAPWRWSNDDEDNDYDGFTFDGFGPSRGGGGDSDSDSDSDGASGSGSGPGDGDGGGGAFGSQRGLSIDLRKANNVRNVHGILAAVLFVGVFPLGAILVRVAKRHVWLHGIVQIIALGGYVAAAALGIWLALYIRIPRGDGTVNLFQVRSVSFHPIIGLLVLALLLLQPLWGVLHHQRFKTLHRRQPWSHLHLWTGRLVIPLGMVNGALGLWRSEASTTVLISYSVVAAVVWGVWMVFAVVHEVRRGKEVAEKGTPGSEGARSPVASSPVASSPVASSPVASSPIVGTPREGSRRVPTVSSLSSDRPRSRRPS